MTSGKAFVLAIGLTALASMVSAQTTAQSGAAATTEIPAGSQDALQEIIVTAQRRSEDVQRAALAIDVVSPQALALAGATGAIPNSRCTCAVWGHSPQIHTQIPRSHSTSTAWLLAGRAQ